MDTIVYISDFRLPLVTSFIKPLQQFPQYRKVLIIEKHNLQNEEVLAGFFDDIHHIEFLESIDEIKAIIEQVRRTSKIIALLTPGENAIEIGGEIRSTFGIQGLQKNQAAAVRNKWLMKQMLQQRGIRTSATAIALTEDDYRRFIDTAGLPIIIKPLSGYASIDTFKINNMQELDDYISSHRKDGQSDLLEEFIHGQEFHCDSIVYRGSVVFSSVAQYLFNALDVARNGRPPASIVFPEDVEFSYVSGINALNERAISALGINNSITHAEYFLTASGEVVFGELGARIGGAQVMPPCVKNTHGVDFFDAVSKIELGVFELTKKPKKGVYTGMVCFPSRAGVIQEISTPQDFEKFGGVVDCQVTYKVGQKVGDVNDTMTRSGFAIVEGRDFDALRQTLLDMYDSFRIRVA